MNICVIYDIDGVLIDVRDSFHQAIKDTISLYLEKILQISVPECFVTDKDISAFKNLGGFNDDWDVTAGILYYLVSLLDEDNKGILAKDIFGFVEKCRGTGLEAILKATQNKNGDKVSFDKSPVEVDQIHPKNQVKRIFQQIYWGAAEFEHIYGESPQYYSGEGVIKKEKLIMPVDFLENLKNKGIHLAIATGRERTDALYSLEKFGLLSFFETIVTLTDVGEDYKKPDPKSLFFLEQYFQQQGLEDISFYYLGDQLDDMQMVLDAEDHMDVTQIGFFIEKDANKEKKMRDLGVEHFFQQHDQLLGLLFSNKD